MRREKYTPMRRYVLCSRQSRSFLCFHLRAPFRDRDGSDAHMEYAEASDLGDGEQRLACSPAYRKPFLDKPAGFKSRQTRNGRGVGDQGGEGAAGAEGQNAGSTSKQSDRFRGESEAELAKGDA